MDDYIPRDAVLQKMWNALYALEDQQEAASGLDILRRADVQAGFEAGQQVVAEFPAADVRPVVRGKWIDYPACLKYKYAFSEDHIVCSSCEFVFNILDNCTELFDFCPNCGADMREVQDNE